MLLVTVERMFEACALLLGVLYLPIAKALVLAPPSASLTCPLVSGNDINCSPHPSITSAEIALFNYTASGNLFAQRPVGAVCYKKDKLYNAVQCLKEVASGNLWSDQWISDQPNA